MVYESTCDWCGSDKVIVYSLKGTVALANPEYYYDKPPFTDEHKVTVQLDECLDCYKHGNFHLCSNS